ncbi:MAG: inositol monophosphatase [Candidatus Moranbacteria bacterium]|nr:inositol monophosphatase [Candidatus Moranbacteria bacterium]MDZ4385344.1 inositol monophosphatase [Candidatus Moranbacteria bacterium]
MEYQDFIVEVLEEASGIARDNFGKVSGVAKAGDNNQVLTETDLEIGQMIVGKIQKYFPTHNIIDEEAGVIDKKSNLTWVVDPIDGTSNFANGIPLYGIMIGLLENDAPIAGGIALPSYAEIYVAEKGQGAYCNGKKIAVSQEVDLKKVLVAYGIDGHQENPESTRGECGLLAEIVLNIRNLRISNSVFDAAMVARGKYGAWLNRTSKIWDNVAQQIIIEEAGGIYTDFFGSPVDYANHINRAEDNFTFLAAPPELHKKLVQIIKTK